MKIVVESLTDGAMEKRDYQDVLRIYINGKLKFNVHDGEPEDANLSRDFNDCWSVTDLMKMAYEAGKNGEEFEIEDLKVDKI